MRVQPRSLLVIDDQKSNLDPITAVGKQQGLEVRELVPTSMDQVVAALVNAYQDGRLPDIIVLDHEWSAIGEPEGGPLLLRQFDPRWWGSITAVVMFSGNDQNVSEQMVSLYCSTVPAEKMHYVGGKDLARLNQVLSVIVSFNPVKGL